MTQVVANWTMNSSSNQETNVNKLASGLERSTCCLWNKWIHLHEVSNQINLLHTNSLAFGSFLCKAGDNTWLFLSASHTYAYEWQITEDRCILQPWQTHCGRVKRLTHKLDEKKVEDRDETPWVTGKENIQFCILFFLKSVRHCVLCVY